MWIYVQLAWGWEGSCHDGSDAQAYENVQNYHTIINYTLDLTVQVAGCYLSCSVDIPQNYFAITLFIPHRDNIIPAQFAMDSVREKLAVVVFLVCWSSQVEAQGQGKQLYH